MTPRPRPRARRLAALGLVTLAVPGCGSGGEPSSGAGFRTGYQAESVKLKAIGTDLGAVIGGAGKMTDAQVAKAFGDLAARAHASAVSLRRLHPPAESRANLTKLENAVEQAGGDLDTITAAARTGDAAGAKTAAAAVVADSAPIRDARAALDKQVKG